MWSIGCSKIAPCVYLCNLFLYEKLAPLTIGRMNVDFSELKIPTSWQKLLQQIHISMCQLILGVCLLCLLAAWPNLCTPQKLDTYSQDSRMWVFESFTFNLIVYIVCLLYFMV